MKQNLFTYLPSEIITNILSRLPLQTIVVSKCVCKSWLDLLESDAFVNSHLRKSIPSLAVLTTPEMGSNCCSVFEFNDEVDADVHDHRRYRQLTNFVFPHKVAIVGAANGLLLLHQIPSFSPETLYICNPITRHYVKFCSPQPEYSYHWLQLTFGFGASKLSGLHKAVQIIPKSILICVCYVYTLETGSWRCFEDSASFTFNDIRFGPCVDGNLHWIVLNTIYCFDLETECFTTIPAPPLEDTGYNGRNLCAFKGYLCMCEDKYVDETVIDIWLMKEYGDEKSWTKEYVIAIHSSFAKEMVDPVYPIKVFEDGDILILWGRLGLFYYSNETRTARQIPMFDGSVSSLPLTPSFLSLKRLSVEDVISF